MDFILEAPLIAGPPDFVPRAVAGLVVRAGRIESVHETAPDRWPDLPRRRLDGGVLLPGFCDAHVHALLTAAGLLATSVREAVRYEDACDAIRGAAALGGEVVRVSGYDETRDPAGRALSRAALDRLVPERPVVVLRVDLHSAWVNTRALERLALTPGVPGLEDGASGQLRGEAFMQAAARLREWITADERAEGIARLGRAAAARGVTSLHCLEGAPEPGDPERAAALELVPKLPQRTRLYLQCFDVAAVSRRGLAQIGGCLLIDGSLGSRTAALDAPYVDEPGTCGVLYHDETRIEALIRRADDRGMQCAFHAIGPRAIEQVLSAYERVLKNRPPRDHRHRIEHFLLPRPDQIDRSAALGLVLGMQPSFHDLWGRPGGMYSARVGADVLRINPIASALAKGLVVAGSSDSDVTALDPLAGVRAAATHPVASERLTVPQALDLWISGSRAAGFESDAGRFAPGQRADWVWLGQDPLAVPVDRLDRIPVKAVWIAGSEIR